VVLTGSGEKSFVAGADIKELAVHTPAGGRGPAIARPHVLDLIEQMGKPVIAAINGYALGGGCELAMACTVRIAADTARLGQPEINLGIIPGYGGTQRLARHVGRARALELVLTSEKGLTAAEAERIGLVNRVVPAGQALPASLELARKIRANGPTACRYALEAVRRGLDMPLAEGQVLEATLFGLCAATEDMKEGMNAFLEKRPAKFTGK
jgi:enoyl-CoA hydratase